MGKLGTNWAKDAIMTPQRRQRRQRRNSDEVVDKIIGKLSR